MKEILNQYKMGDMHLVYLLDTETNICGMTIVPSDKPFDLVHDSKRRIRVHSLIQAKLVGDNYPGQYYGGESMRESDTVQRLKYSTQECVAENGELKVITVLEAEDGLRAVNTAVYNEGDEYITISTELVNGTGKDIKCEMLSSFSISNISPYSEGAGTEELFLHRLRSKWSKEGRLVTESFEDLQLEDVWCYCNGKSMRFGQVGSLPVKNYFPFMAVEDNKHGVLWGVQMGCPSSWQMELTKGDDGAEMSGGIADREFGHWMKTIRNKERFKTIPAVITVCTTNIDDLCARLVSAQEKSLNIPESEKALPVIFNEYCTTWGNPSHDNIERILNSVKGRGIDYFVIDCGWYREDGIPWHRSMGEYIPSETLFPQGIKKTVDTIHSCGMKAGIWFEFENIGPECRAFEKTDHVLKRDGIPLTTQNRRFWDMNDPWVKDYLSHRVIEFMNKNGFEYIKVDYNETIGIGCDNSDSLGEGLRQNMIGTQLFFKRIRDKVPNVVIENCASGGHRLESSFMALSSMASFSDAHECVEIPIIAANLHRVILPRQSQIWCVIRKSDSLKRICYSVAAGLLGRMCLSGDVTELTEEQWNVIDNGINFYKSAASVIKNGRSHIYRCTTGSDRHPRGWQAVVRNGTEKTLVTVHTFGGEMPDKLEIPVKADSIEAVYSYRHTEFCIENNTLIVSEPEEFAGYGIIIKNK
ncbi:MAG: alpha-galactosidase [bacterium]|nr:alpha-galactosidase [bacterium]